MITTSIHLDMIRLKAQAEAICTMFEYVPYDDETTDEMMCAYILAHSTVPQTVEDMREAVEFVQRVAGMKSQYVFSGYTDVVCNDAPSFVCECHTHFLGEEGLLDEPDVDKETERMFDLTREYRRSLLLASQDAEEEMGSC